MSGLSDLLVDHPARNVAWCDLPLPLGLAPLLVVRNKMREKNPHDTEEPPLAS